MNLGVGAYRSEEGTPYVFNAVKKAEEIILRNPAKFNHEYLGIAGYAPFVESSQKLIFGDNCQAVKDGRVATLQTLSGTGSLTVAFQFLKIHNPAPVYMPNPTWGNHKAIVEMAGLPVRTYPYWNPKTRGLDFEGMINRLKEAPVGAIVLLHPCAHNPTGVDPTEAQWSQILKVCKESKLIVFFDSAYQGFASGNFEKDAYAVRLFMKEGVNFILSQSFAKNFGLYGERVGCLHFVTESKATATKLDSQVKLIVRAMYSNPPCHGAFIVDTIVRDPTLYKEFLAELEKVSARITNMRTALYNDLVTLKVPGSWTHITSQIGMFSYTGLSVKQCEQLIKKWHVYLLKNGRISMAGINSKNVSYLAKAIADVVANN